MIENMISLIGATTLIFSGGALVSIVLYAAKQYSKPKNVYPLLIFFSALFIAGNYLLYWGLDR